MIGYVDCFSGVSGDMMLGALVDAGWPVERLSSVVAALDLSETVRIRADPVDRAGLRATLVRVDISDQPASLRLEEIEGRVRAAPLPEVVRSSSLAVVRRLAEAETVAHGRPAAQIALHTPIDTIVDVVGSVSGLAELGVDQLFASALPAGPSRIRDPDHGVLPGPAPATLALLAAAHAPLRPFGEGRELVTPTGAALLVTLARFQQPPMRLERSGCGAGTQELPWPNLVRLWLGRADHERVTTSRVVLETNLDDMTPQILAAVTERLLAAGALDVSVTPLLMKKGRPGWLVAVIADPQDEAPLAELLLRETSTLGVRVHDVRRFEAPRRLAEVETPYGRVAVKLKVLDGRVLGAAPEFDSVRTAAAASGASLARVHAAASAAALALLDGADPEGKGARSVSGS